MEYTPFISHNESLFIFFIPIVPFHLLGEGKNKMIASYKRFSPFAKYRTQKRSRPHSVPIVTLKKNYILVSLQQNNTNKKKNSPATASAIEPFPERLRCRRCITLREREVIASAIESLTFTQFSLLLFFSSCLLLYYI